MRTQVCVDENAMKRRQIARLPRRCLSGLPRWHHFLGPGKAPEAVMFRLEKPARAGGSLRHADWDAGFGKSYCSQMKEASTIAGIIEPLHYYPIWSAKLHCNHQL